MTTRLTNASRNSTRFALALVAVGGLIATGCGSNEVADEPYNPNSGPLAELLGYNFSPTEQRAKELELQQFLVECMNDEGWEYIAVDYSASNPYQDEYEEQMTDPQGYGEKYGYGVVRNYELNAEGGGFGVGVEDPNGDYVMSLSESEREDYYASLYGKQDFGMPVEGEDGEVIATMPPLENQGCQGQAQLEVYGESPYNDPDMSERLNELYEDMASDQRITDAYEVWSTCMADLDASYEWATPDEVWSYFYDQLNVLQGYEPQVFEDTVDSAAPIATSVVGPGGPGGEPLEIDQADLDDLQQEEITVWADDQQCQDEAALADVRREVEQQMVDDLLADFPELGGE
jgi:hypothetical protein